MTTTQYRLILAHLKTGQTIDRNLACTLKFQYCGRLAARICEMRKMGHVIHKTMYRTCTGSYIAIYSLQKEAGK